MKQEKKKVQKAWFYEEYGPKEVLKLGDIPIPTPQHNQLLVKVRAAALNPIDFKMRQRPIVPLDFPVVPGCDMAGAVVAKGGGVSRFDIGDEVYGNIQNFNAEGKLLQFGTLAEFVVVEESMVAAKPKNISFEDAASLPVAVQTAMEGFKTAGFKEGQTVFVVGGGGGVGTLVVQLAKQFYGASEVVATSSTSKVEFVKSLGADKVVDYTKTRYEELEEKYDLLYDTIGDSKNSFVVAKDDAPIIDITWPPSNPRAVHSSLTVSGEILEKLRPYLESGKLKAVIDPTGDSKNSFGVAKDDAPIIDITWPPSNPSAVHSSLTVSGEILEKLRPYLESGKLKAVIDPTGHFHFSDVIEAF